MKLYLAELNSKNFHVLLNTITAEAKRSLPPPTGDSNATVSLIRRLRIFIFRLATFVEAARGKAALGAGRLRPRVLSGNLLDRDCALRD